MRKGGHVFGTELLDVFSATINTPVPREEDVVRSVVTREKRETWMKFLQSVHANVELALFCIFQLNVDYSKSHIEVLTLNLRSFYFLFVHLLQF